MSATLFTSSIELILATSGKTIPTEFPAWDETLWCIIGIVFFLLANAFFVASEFAIVKVRPSQLAAAENKKRNKTALKIVQHLDTYLSVNQLGITFSSLALGFLGEPFVMKLVAPILANPYFKIPDSWVLGISIFIAYASFTVLHVILGELIPKSIAIRHPLKTTTLLAAPLDLFYACSSPLIRAMNGTANWILRNILRITPATGHEHVHSADELALLVAESERQQEVTETEREILINALELSDLSVKSILTPRGEVAVLDVDDPFEKNLQLVRETKHTRFPLVRGHLDNAIGQVHVKDFLKLIGRSEPDLMSIRRELKAVPLTMPLDVLLKFFLDERTHLALVVDEFGDSKGLVFLDDVLAELVGDIQDEFDIDETPEFQAINDNEFVVKGNLTLNELHDFCPQLELEDPEVSTVSGYVIQQIGHIPDVGEETTILNYQVKVLSSDGRRIGALYFKRNPELEPNSDED